MKHKIRLDNIKTQPKHKHIAPAVGAALVTGGASLLGGLLGMKGQSNANAANERINERNLQWQEEMWNKTNEYNNATNQRQRLLDAGINPLSVQGMGTAQAQNLSAPQQLPMQNSMAALGQGVSNAGLAAAQAANIMADTKVKERQADNIAASTDLTKSQQYSVDMANRIRKATENEEISSNRQKYLYEYTKFFNDRTVQETYREFLSNEDNNSIVRDAFRDTFKQVSQNLVNSMEQEKLIKAQTDEQKAKAKNYAEVVAATIFGIKAGMRNTDVMAAMQKYVSDQNYALGMERIDADKFIADLNSTRTWDGFLIALTKAFGVRPDIAELIRKKAYGLFGVHPSHGNHGSSGSW